jgi:hypothetical protein
VAARWQHRKGTPPVGPAAKSDSMSIMVAPKIEQCYIAKHLQTQFLPKGLQVYQKYKISLRLQNARTL